MKRKDQRDKSRQAVDSGGTRVLTGVLYVATVCIILGFFVQAFFEYGIQR